MTGEEKLKKILLQNMEDRLRTMQERMEKEGVEPDEDSFSIKVEPVLKKGDRLCGKTMPEKQGKRRRRICVWASLAAASVLLAAGGYALFHSGVGMDTKSDNHYSDLSNSLISGESQSDSQGSVYTEEKESQYPVWSLAEEDQPSDGTIVFQMWNSSEYPVSYGPVTKIERMEDGKWILLYEQQEGEEEFTLTAGESCMESIIPEQYGFSLSQEKDTYRFYRNIDGEETVLKVAR
ncbi:MAG: hypothetical protein PUB10_07780 [Clostridiales bacterium]|nr:hypothetical protein [Clostridiales bacterium]